MVNVRTPGAIASLFGSRHWFALRKFGERWYNLDSKLAQPQLVSEAFFSEEGDVDEDTALRNYLAKLQKEANAKVLLVM